MEDEEILGEVPEGLYVKPPWWWKELDARELKEVQLARYYAEHLAHGTSGHNRLMLIAKLADLLDGV